jgi:hypothetical protein
MMTNSSTWDLDTRKLPVLMYLQLCRELMKSDASVKAYLASMKAMSGTKTSGRTWEVPDGEPTMILR